MKKTIKNVFIKTAVMCVALLSPIAASVAAAETIKVAGIYTQPIQQKWDARLHTALLKAQKAGDIEYVFSEKVSNADYARVMRQYAENGVDLVVGEAFGIGREARKVAKAYPEVAFLMGDPFKADLDNYSVFDNYIHEPCFLMGMIAGSLTKTNKIGMVGGYPIGEVNRLFNAFMAGAKSVNSEVEFKVNFIGSWYDPPKAKEASFAQIESGVDILFAERAGVVDAAREKGIMAFGNVNDMNVEEKGEGVVVTSALWNMENAIAHAVKRVKEKTFKGEDYREWTMMAKGGAMLAPYHDMEAVVSADMKAQVSAKSAAILAGEFVVEINDKKPASSF
ncbi:MAG: basic membrane protein A [Oceanospirillaceae bacterium]|jgi:basic membrane protein A